MVNAALVGVPLDQRERVVERVLKQEVPGWSVTREGIVVRDKADQYALQEFLDRNPDFRRQLLLTLAGQAQLAASGAAPPSNVPDAPSQLAASWAEAAHAPTPMSAPRHAGRQVPIGLHEAIQRFARRKADGNGTRTVEDRTRLLLAFAAHVRSALSREPFVHDVTALHLTDFVDDAAARRGRGPAAATAAPSTVRRKLSDLDTFFAYARDELEAIHKNPVDGLRTRIRELDQQASASKRSYRPLDDQQIARIFEPERYLRNNRDPDYFWCPLLGAHLGVRLREIVSTPLSAVRQDADGGWHLEVRPEQAKNSNSVRAVPITRPLLELGFIEYVEHVKALGATNLWPHRDLDGPTARRLPSKSQSRAFAAHLDDCGLSDPQLVFHSWRHTVVTALLDGGTPLPLSMRICGHEAQDEGVRRGLLDAKAARSVHLTTYAHADVPRLGVASPLAEMREALERCVVLPIDYARLRTAARIIVEHITKRRGVFATGWVPQRTEYTATQVARLRDESNS